MLDTILRDQGIAEKLSTPWSSPSRERDIEEKNIRYNSRYHTVADSNRDGFRKRFYLNRS